MVNTIHLIMSMLIIFGPLSFFIDSPCAGKEMIIRIFSISFSLNSGDIVVDIRMPYIEGDIYS